MDVLLFLLMVTDPRQIRRIGSGFSQVDSVFHKNYTAGCVHGVRTRLTFFLRKTESTWENPDPKRRISRKTTVKYPELGSRKTCIQSRDKVMSSLVPSMIFYRYLYMVYRLLYGHVALLTGHSSSRCINDFQQPG